MPKVRMNGKEVCRTKLHKTQRMTGLLCAVLEVIRERVNIFSANEADMLRSVKLLYYIC